MRTKYPHLFFANLDSAQVGAEGEDDRIQLLLPKVKGKDMTELIASGGEKLASLENDHLSKIIAAYLLAILGGNTSPTDKDLKKILATGLFSVSYSEKEIPIVAGKSKSESKDKEKKHKKHKDKDKEHKKHKHRHKDRCKDKDKEKKKDRTGHHDSGADLSKWKSGFRDSLKIEENAESKLVKALPSVVIVEREGHIISCAALFPYFEEKCGEVSAIVVSPDCRGQGQGDKLFDQSGISTRDKGLSWEVSLNLMEERNGQIMKSNLTDLRSYCKVLMVYFPASVLLKDSRDTILHIQVEKGDPEKLHSEREQLEMQRRKAKAKLQDGAKTAEEAQRRAEVEAAAEAKRRREHDSEAVRQALLQENWAKHVCVDVANLPSLHHRALFSVGWDLPMLLLQALFDRS
ncbi:60S acidic ribosomal protein P2 [Capsicum annuum]|nr:60S acidic ribosomal protein P2 [Capsicum annuum]KAF3679393.1 60S acidic ribosomal protein P2 [Capsicum annuum]